MQTPDLCTALMGLIDAQYAAGRHLDATGAVDHGWLYATVAMAGIGHSRREHYARLAAAAFHGLSNTDRTAFASTHELPANVTQLLLADDTGWPPASVPQLLLAADAGGPPALPAA